jgi:hypothetical protein
MKTTFMASYNMDTFRRFVFESSFPSRYAIPRQRLAPIEKSDAELLLLGWAGSAVLSMTRNLFRRGR